MVSSTAADAAADLGDALTEADATVGVVETCTGGLISAHLTGEPGASGFFVEGLAPYSYDAVRTRVGITREAIDANGVISETVTRQLARRARDRTDSTWGLSTTGIAGPSGGSPEKPVGTAYVGLAYAGPWETESSYTKVHAYEFDGDRATIRNQLTTVALRNLHDEISAQSNG